MEYTLPKGVFDILPEEPEAEYEWRNSDHWQYIESIMRQTAHTYGFKEIRTPIFEKTELFIRGVGESSDIVTKEMYTFQDKGDRSMTLRPEGTAAVMRAFVEHRLYTQPSLHKYYYIGPMFRYERPQAGRYRQHHQLGAEAIGNGSAEQDVEILDMLCELYRRLGLKDLTIILNSVGDEQSRIPYREALKNFLAPHFNLLSKESQVRLEKNPLRILDSKDPQEQKILQEAPSILNFLNEECRTHFNQVCKLLDKLGLPYLINPKLVRGLDYYNKTVFEIVSSELGAQNSLVGGGRYDGLTAKLGAPSLPAVGFATGIERLLQTMTKQNAYFPAAPHPLVLLIPLGEESVDYCFSLLCQLRHEGIPVEIDLRAKKVQQGLQLANTLHAKYALIIGEEELRSQKATLKQLDTRQSQEFSLKELLSVLKKLS